MMMRISKPNFIIISGSGKKVGKTYLATALIREFVKSAPVIALKISPHVHDSPGDSKLIASADGVRLFRECIPNRKNSGQYLEAGAQQSYFMETEDDHLEAAFALFQDTCNAGNLPVICESGALGSLVKPGVMIFIAEKGFVPGGLKKTRMADADLVLPAKEFLPEQVITQIRGIKNTIFVYNQMPGNGTILNEDQRSNTVLPGTPPFCSHGSRPGD